MQVAAAGAVGGAAGCTDDCGEKERFKLYKDALDGNRRYTFETDEGDATIELEHITPDETAKLNLTDEATDNEYLRDFDASDEPYDLEEMTDGTIDYLPDMTVENVVHEEDVGKDEGIMQFSFDEPVKYC